MFCKHCNGFQGTEHQDGKCLFQPTTFEPYDCICCDEPVVDAGFFREVDGMTRALHTGTCWITLSRRHPLAFNAEQVMRHHLIEKGKL